MDPAVHRLPTVRRTGSRAAGGHLHAGLSHHLRGLINSISQYFSTLFGKLSYRQWVLVMTGFSFLVCNLGLNAILSISIPILNAIYPRGHCADPAGADPQPVGKNRWVYSLMVAGTGTVSVIYALDAAQLSLGAVTELCRKLPLYDMGFCWVSVAAVMLAVSLLLGLVRGGVRAEKACPSPPRLVE